MRKLLVLLAFVPILAACDFGGSPPTPANTSGVTEGGKDIKSFCDSVHGNRVYYMEYSDGGGNHMALAVIKDDTCPK